MTASNRLPGPRTTKPRTRRPRRRRHDQGRQTQAPPQARIPPPPRPL